MIKNILDKKSKILIVGLGHRTGLFSANFLLEKKFEVTVCDIKPKEKIQKNIDKLHSGVEVIAGNQDSSILNNGYDLIVLSPGVPAKIPLIKEAENREIPVISEVELAYHFMKGFWIAITGTDGKSTTTALTNFILKKMNYQSREGGNIGIPLVSLADPSNEETITVAELSSFQLETIHNFCPDAAAFLNLSPDHLDRYDSMDSYFNAKMNVVKNQTDIDFFVYNKDCMEINNYLDNIKSQKRSFSLSDNSADAYISNNNIVINTLSGVKMTFNIKEMKILGVHNALNAMAALLLAESCLAKMNIVIDMDKAIKVCKEFPGLAHRMEPCGNYKNRTFINDSKATTVGAVEMAVKSLDSKAVIILGGRGKGDDYSRLCSILRDKINGVVLIGETSEEFSQIFEEFSHVIASDMKDAVLKAYGLTEPGQSILLSPACASFDMFSSFEERGDVFKETVAQFIAEESN